uniref:Uncharacterized protein n=1 Tax=Acrobeloides nanus TaxID=290746 RepID=A0A914DJG1_9BILA
MYSLLTKNQDINNPEYFRCCCGCHVKKGALIIASISIFGSVLQLFSGNIGSILSGIVGICASVLVFCADNKERAWAYIPYLVLQALGIIGCLVAIFIFLAGVIVSPQWLFDTLNEKEFLTHDLGIWTLHGNI